MITYAKIKPDEVNSSGAKFIKEENLPFIIGEVKGFKMNLKSYEKDNADYESFYVEIKNKKNIVPLVNCKIVRVSHNKYKNFIVNDNDNNSYYTHSLSKALDICRSVLYVQSKGYHIIARKNEYTNPHFCYD